MEELRSSSRAEVLKAWAEVERVEDEKVEILDRNLELLSELRTSADRERGLQRQVEELRKCLSEQRVGAVVEDSKKSNQNLRLFLTNNNAFRKNGGDKSGHEQGASERSISSWSTINSTKVANIGCGTRDSISSVLSVQDAHQEIRHRWVWDSTTNTTGDSLLYQKGDNKKLQNEINNVEREKQNLIAEFKMQASFRESVLQSMDQTRKIQGETIEQLRKQLKTQEYYAYQKEVTMKQEIHNLTKKLQEKRKYISKQYAKLKECRSCITDLSAELERIHRASQTSRDDARQSIVVTSAAWACKHTIVL